MIVMTVAGPRPALAANETCSVTGSVVTCEGATEQGIHYGNGPVTEIRVVANPDGDAIAVEADAIGISLDKSGVAGKSAANQGTPTEYKNTSEVQIETGRDEDDQPIIETWLVLAGSDDAPILVDGYFVRVFDPGEFAHYQLAKQGAVGESFEDGVALAHYLQDAGVEDGGTISAGIMITNNASFETSGAAGILAQSLGGAGGRGGCTTILIASWCRDGKAGGNAGSIAVTNNGELVVADAVGIRIQSLGGTGGAGGGAFGLLASAAGRGGRGGDGGAVSLLLNGSSAISTTGDLAHGVYVSSMGGNGGNGGRPSGAISLGEKGGNGGNSGLVTITNHGTIITGGSGAHAIFAESLGAGAGSGSDSAGILAVGGNGGGEANAANVTVTNSGTLYTSGANAYGILALSIGGGGGDGGHAGGLFSVGGRGGSGGGGGIVTVDHTGSITTEGAGSVGILAQSIGGGGGNGGGAFAANPAVPVAVGGSGGLGGKGNKVTINALTGGADITSLGNSTIHTSGDRAHGVQAQSIGGGGGNGGLAMAAAVGSPIEAHFAMGGSGAQGGDAEDVTVNLAGSVTTGGHQAHGIFAQSIGGGGGTGGGAVSAGGGVISLGVALGGSAGQGGAAGEVHVAFIGDLGTGGAQSHGILAQSVGGGGGSGGFAVTGSVAEISGSLAMGGNGAKGGDGHAVVVELGRADRGGQLMTLGQGAHGILAQSIGGSGGNGGLAGAAGVGNTNISVSLGGNGNGGGDGAAVDVTNYNSIVTGGAGSMAILAQSIGGGGGNGGAALSGTAGSFAASLSFGGRGAGGGKGEQVTVHNNGAIMTLGEGGHAIFAQSVGGGGGNGGIAGSLALTNGGSVSVSLGGKGAGGGAGGEVDVINIARIDTLGANAHAIFAQSVGGGGGNGGLALGGSAGVISASAAVGGSGGSGGAGEEVRVTNLGAISTIGELSYGIFAQSVGGGGGNGGSAMAGSLALSIPDVPAIGASVAIGGRAGGGGAGDAVTVNNLGNISTGTATADIFGFVTRTGAGSHAIFVQSIGGGGGTGGFAGSLAVSLGTGASFAVSVGGAGGAGGAGDAVEVNNYAGFVTTLGDGANGIHAQSIGGGGGDGGFGLALAASGGGSTNVSASVALGGSGGSGGAGGTAQVLNHALVATGGSYANAVVAQSIGGGGGTGGFAVSGTMTVGTKAGQVGVAVGGSGGTGGNSSAVTVDNHGQLITTGNLSLGLLAQSIGGGGGNGGMSVTGQFAVATESSGQVGVSIGGSGGAAGDGSSVTLTNHANAHISTTGFASHAIQAQSVGGGGGNGGMALHGSFATSAEKRALNIGVAVGGSGAGGGQGGVVTVINDGDISTRGDAAVGIFSQSIGGGGGNGGSTMIDIAAANLQTNKVYSIAVGVGGSGGAGNVGGLVDITNNGTIVTGSRTEFFGGTIITGSASHGIFAQSVGGGGGWGGASIVKNKFTGCPLAGACSFLSTSDQPTNDEGKDKPKPKIISVAVGGDGGSGGHGGVVSVSNNGTIITMGHIAYGVLAQSVGGGGGLGGAGLIDGGETLNLTLGGKAAGGGDGNAVTLSNDGAIITLGEFSTGLFAQSIGGGGGIGGLASSAGNGTIAIGGKGGAAGNGGAVTVTNTHTIATIGQYSSGIFAQSVGGGGGLGGGSLIKVEGPAGLTIGGEGGEASHGGAVAVTNEAGADIVTMGTLSYGIFAQSVGGGGGAGGTTSVEKSGTVNVSIGGNAGGGPEASNGGTVDVTNHGHIITLGSLSHAIVGQSIGGGGGMGGDAAIAAGGTIDASVGGKGSAAGDGNIVTIANTGDITTFGSLSFGIMGQSIGGGGGMGGSAASESKGKIIAHVGGQGGASGNGALVHITNEGHITTAGFMSHGIFAQSVGGGGGVGGNAPHSEEAKYQLGGAGDATSGGHGGDITLRSLNDSLIETFGAGAYGIYAQSVGGGGGQAGSTATVKPSTPTADGNPPQAPVATGQNAPDGGGANSGGDGGNIDVHLVGNILTHGDGATGLFAQSVGGGGGLTGGTTGTAADSSHAGSNGDTGSGGSIDIALNGSIHTSGNSATGIFAQSSGGTGTGADVTIDVAGSVVAASFLALEDGSLDNPLRGLGSVGIFAHSSGYGGNGDININLTDATGLVRGGRSLVVNPDPFNYSAYTGVGIWLVDGADNTVTNHGTIMSADGVNDGYAILATGSDPFNLDSAKRQNGGNETIHNHGAIIGSIDLGAGTNTLINHENAWIDTGKILNLGAHSIFRNDGVLAIGSIEGVTSTRLTGSYEQGATGLYIVELDMSRAGRTDATDLLDVSGFASLEGTIAVGLLNVGQIKPGTYSSVFLRAADTLDVSAAEFILPESILAKYSVATSTNEVAFSYTADFMTSDLTENQSSLGEYFDAIQRAGSAPELAEVIQSLFVMTDERDYEAALQQMLPQSYLANEVALSQSSSDFARRLMSCRVAGGDNRFIAEGECEWANVAYNHANRTPTAANLGYDLRSAAVSVGAQRKIGEGLFGGFGFAVETTGGTSGVNSTVTTHGVHLGGVLKGQTGGTTVAASVSAGLGVSNIERTVTLPLVSYQLRGTQHLSYAGAGLSFSHAFEAENVYLKPQIDFGVTGVGNLGYSETGGPIALNAGTSGNVFVTIAPSLEVGGEFKLDEATLLRPFLRGGMTATVAGTAPTVSAAISAAPTAAGDFGITENIGEPVFDLTLGADLINSSGFNLRAMGQARMSDNNFSYGLQVKASNSF